MRKNAVKEQENKERYKFLAVVVLFLISGICYSHSFYGGELDMGRETSVEEIGIVEEEDIPAETFSVKLDINHATLTELMMLEGIGESRAADIIAYREENGAFSRIEDIMKVSGIGEKTFEEIKEQIIVGE